MTDDPVRRLRLDILQVTPMTRWAFLVLETRAGLTGTGEATLQGREDALASGMVRLRALAEAMPHAAPQDGSADGPADMASAALRSALDQALWDVEARRRGVPLAAALGGARRHAVPLYANINRRTRDRSPAGFAASALDALRAGHDTLKIAPFDEVTPEARRQGMVQREMQAGLARIEAVRAAIGPERRLLVDCHWRFDEDTARALIARCAALEVGWVECPLPDTEGNIPALRRLRREAERHGTLLAGGETLTSISAFAPFLDAGAYDVMMPDVKYVGGIGPMTVLAERMQGSGCAFSPHNPSGPVCHAASLHLCAAATSPGQLEMQFDETELFETLAVPSLGAPHAGAAAVPLDRPGIGIALDPALAGAHRVMTA